MAPKRRKVTCNTVSRAVSTICQLSKLVLRKLSSSLRCCVCSSRLTEAQLAPNRGSLVWVIVILCNPQRGPRRYVVHFTWCAFCFFANGNVLFGIHVHPPIPTGVFDRAQCMSSSQNYNCATMETGQNIFCMIIFD